MYRPSNKTWTKLKIGFLLFVPLYLIPSVLRSQFAGSWGYPSGIALSDTIGSILVGFLTNNYWFGLGLYVCSTALECVLLFAGQTPRIALWLGDLIPALVAIYYAQQLYINMGD